MVLSMTQIRIQLNNFNSVVPVVQDVKSAMNILISEEPQPSDADCIQQLRDDLPPNTLFCSEMLSGPTTLFRLLRDYLILKGLTYSPHPGTSRLSHGIVNMLYDDENDVGLSFQYLQQYKSVKSPDTSSDISNDNSQRIPTSPGSQLEPSTRVAHNMAVRFKGYQRFSGKLGEDLAEHISNYMDAAKDYNLSSNQLLDYLHHILDGEAKRFYRHKVHGVVDTFSEACKILTEEYNSLTRQSRVRKHLQSLRLADVMKRKKLSITEGLEELRDVITRLTPQGPPTHRNDEDKVEYLYKAVVGATWAKSALSNSQSSSPPWNFHQLYSALDAAWLQEQEEKEARKRDGKIDISSSKVSNESVPGMFFQGQGFYGKPKQRGSKSSNPYVGLRRRPHHKPYTPRTGKNGTDRNGKPRVCHNCNSPDHLIRDCDKPRNLIRNVGRLLSNNPKDAKKILYELCIQSEEALFENDGSNAFFTDENEDEEQENVIDDPEEPEEESNINHFNSIFQDISEENHDLADVFEDF